MIEKQPYSAPLAETFVVQTESQLCIVSPLVLYGVFSPEDGGAGGDLIENPGINL